MCNDLEGSPRTSLLSWNCSFVTLIEDMCVEDAPDLDSVSFKHFITQDLGSSFLHSFKKIHFLKKRPCPFLHDWGNFRSAYVTSNPFMLKTLSPKQHARITWMESGHTGSFCLCFHVCGVNNKFSVEGVNHSFCSYKNCRISKYKIQRVACHLHRRNIGRVGY